MNSPDKHFFNFIEIDKELTTPIYIQLVEQIIKGIQLGYLENGTKLPGTRILSQLLNLNRNTIVKSLDELQAQEWIKIIPNKGTYIHVNAHQFKNKISAKTINGFSKKSGFKFEKSVLFDLPITPTSQQTILDDGLVDRNTIEYKIPAKNYVGLLKRNINPKLSRNAFEKQFTNYIKLSRNINCKPQNILIANNQEIILHIVCKILNSDQLNLAIPALNHYKSNIIFLSNHVKIYPIKMDKNQFDLTELTNLAKNKTVNALYLPSNFSYPTTKSINFNQKNEIEELAKKYHLIIIEHDPFADYYYTPNAMNPFAATNFNDNTLYISKFGDFLSHNFNFGFLIAPEDFIEEAKKHLYLLENNRDEIALQTIGEMIKEGEVVRILKKHRKLYKEKRNLLCQLLHDNFKNEIEINYPNGGLAIWIEWKFKINLLLFKHELEKHQIYIPQHCLYQTNNITAIRLGFASLNQNQIETIATVFYQIYLQIKTSN